MIHFHKWIELSLSFPTHVYLQNSDVGARSYDRLKNGVHRIGSTRRGRKFHRFRLQSRTRGPREAEKMDCAPRGPKISIFQCCVSERILAIGSKSKVHMAPKITSFSLKNTNTMR